METKIMVKGDGLNQEIIGECLFDCIETAYRNYKGQRVELIWVQHIGYIDGKNLFIEDQFLDRHSVKEIMGSGDTS